MLSITGRFDGRMTLCPMKEGIWFGAKSWYRWPGSYANVSLGEQVYEE